MATQDKYLIWSHEHGGWWGPDRCGYQKRFSQAGRYTREQALQICTEAMPGTTARMGALPELPVRESDVHEMIEMYPFVIGLETVL